MYGSIHTGLVTGDYLHHVQVITKTITRLLSLIFLALGWVLVRDELWLRLLHKTCLTTSLTHPLISCAILWWWALSHCRFVDACLCVVDVFYCVWMTVVSYVWLIDVY